MGLVAEGRGWIRAGEELLWTSDGGETWIDITPPWGRLDLRSGVFFLDDQHGWSTTVRPNGQDQPSTVTVYRTADGGRTWEEASFQGPPLIAGVIPPSFGGPLQFVDAQNGWFAASYGGIYQAGYPFRTTDGGRTWSRIAYPVQGGFGYRMRFLDPLRGWLAVLGDDILYETRDGGTSWLAAALGAVPGCEGTGPNENLPVPFEGGYAVLAARQECADQHGTTFHVSDDSGASWRAVGFRAGAHDMLIITATVWLDLRQDRVFRTRDAGEHWEDVTREWSGLYRLVGGGVNFTSRFFKFAGDAYGWSIAAVATRLVATPDGGASWRVIWP